jgi:hypothetical protein
MSECEERASLVLRDKPMSENPEYGREIEGITARMQEIAAVKDCVVENLPRHGHVVDYRWRISRGEPPVQVGQPIALDIVEKALPEDERMALLLGRLADLLKCV